DRSRSISPIIIIEEEQSDYKKITPNINRHKHVPYKNGVRSDDLASSSTRQGACLHRISRRSAKSGPDDGIARRSRELSTAICAEKRRLELRFRPESIYSKPAFGDRHNKTGLVLRIRTRRKRSQPNEVEIRSLEIAVESAWYLDSRACVTSSCCRPFGINRKDLKAFRTFCPQSHSVALTRPQLSIFKAKDILADMMGATEKERAKRTKHGIYVSFNLLDPLPTEANALALETIKSRNVRQEVIAMVTKKIRGTSNLDQDCLKGSLQLRRGRHPFTCSPSLAFYFVNGPWRGTWVRFGYDPRKWFESRYYSCWISVSRAVGAMHDKVKVKRTQNPVRPCMRFSNPARTIVTRANRASIGPRAKQSDYVFTPDTLPQVRIIFYQYCDVKVPRIQANAEKIPTPLMGAACNEKTGWLPPRFDEQCRDILTEIVLTNFKEKKGDDRPAPVPASSRRGMRLR
ncbi:LOW QUALITY PROTEIN: general transcription factor 3C polypeptide 5, partial [Aedes aegypti]|uniref:Uncharacterized protein n=1 Tax=Aedes aegypti TaxID=7159 RepID=A0A6I8U905_AEDAE